MSRKKSQFDSNQLKKIGSRIKVEREGSGLGQAEFGESIGISGNYLSDLETGKVEPRKPILLALEYRYAIRCEYILFGTLPKYIIKEKIAVPVVVEGNQTGVVSDPTLPYGPETDNLLQMAGEVLESGTDYAWSLAANIRCFHNAVTTEKELSTCKRGLSDHEKRLAALEVAGEGHPEGSKKEGVM